MAFGDDRLPARFWEKVEITDSGCWQWTAHIDAGGYARFMQRGGPVRAHRLAFEMLVCEIKEGLVLDHLCRNRSCVNPTHLDQVTQRVNTVRGNGWAGRHFRKTKCKSGHPLSGQNLRVESYGGKTRRRCVQCHRESQARKYWRNRDSILARQRVMQRDKYWRDKEARKKEK